MRAEIKSKLIEVTVIVEAHDIRELARKSPSFPKGGVVVEEEFDDGYDCDSGGSYEKKREPTYRLRVQAPDGDPPHALPS